MANTTFSGPVRVGNGDNGTAWPLTAAASVALVPTAAASTDFSIVVPRCRALRITTITDTAFTGSTVTLAVGTTQGGAQLVAAANVKAAGTVTHTLVAANANTPIAAGATIWFRLAQTGPTAVGAATTTFEFVPLP